MENTKTAACGLITTESKITMTTHDGKIVFNIGEYNITIMGVISTDDLSVIKVGLDEAYKLGFAHCGEILMPKAMETK